MGEKKNIRNYRLFCMVLAAACFYSASCMAENTGKAKADPYYICGPKEDRETLTSLFTLLDKGNSGTDIERFAVILEIANNYIHQKEYAVLINFLTSMINLRPHDTYNTYYLFMTAYAYIQEEAYPAAALYFNMIIKNYPDMTVMGESIHLACFNQLIHTINNPEQQVWYYEELISRFPDNIDLGAAYFLLAQAYEKTGEWNNAIRSYTQYRDYIDLSVVPGFPNAGVYAKELLDFNQSPKNWAFESLNSMVNTVKRALDDGSPWELEQCRAKINFFARTWEMEAADDKGMADFDLSSFMHGSQILYNAGIDAGSTANEAYLRTWGWENISTWYFYFRKIYFPADPQIHGRWEWAGIYYGEKF
ncbi:MAG: tetratricopeptide repeat protein [Treponema sp.]|jgi:tetratricopeptide (TPR) repeat protein|nr:tetratricopeptide repeat protein [Treponema sp.]